MALLRQSLPSAMAMFYFYPTTTLTATFTLTTATSTLLLLSSNDMGSSTGRKQIPSSLIISIEFGFGIGPRLNIWGSPKCAYDESGMYHLECQYRPFV